MHAHAADAAGATRMDRPEWAGVNPANGEIYVTLTNNSSRTATNTDPANPRFYDNVATNGTVTRGNRNGHVIRMAEAAGNAGNDDALGRVPCSAPARTHLRRPTSPH